MQRIQYIDRLKGVAMLAVLVCHISDWILCQKDSPIRLFCDSFQMPLFFMLSGIVISEPPSLKKCGRKILSFWAPLFTVGMVYSYMREIKLSDYVCGSYKSGYWYLWVLGLFYFFISLFHYLQFKGKVRLLVDALGGAMIMLSVYLADRYTMPSCIGILSLNHLYHYWPYFFVGYLFRRYNVANNIEERRDWMASLALVAGMPLYYFLRMMRRYDDSGQIITLLNWTLGFCFILVFFHLFRNREQSGSIIERGLAEIGKRSLDVYIFHYFFVTTRVMNLKYLGIWFASTGNWLLDAAFCTVLAVLISLLTMGVGYMVRHCQGLNVIVYGKIPLQSLRESH